MPTMTDRWLRVIGVCAGLSVGIQLLLLYLAWQIARLARLL